MEKVNQILPPSRWVPSVKINLIFKAAITSSRGVTKNVPISIIESYQEPKTNSIRLGMEELKDSEASFKLTVAHEYSHLVFESISRRAGSTPSHADHISFWPKSIYEGLADLLMSIAMNSDFTADPKSWAARDLNEFKSLKDAQNAKDNTVNRARAAFEKMQLIPDYPIYEDWLKHVSGYIDSIGGADPYAEGTWLAGSLRKQTIRRKEVSALMNLLIESAASGRTISDIQKFHDDLLNHLGKR